MSMFFQPCEKGLRIPSDSPIPPNLCFRKLTALVLACVTSTVAAVLSIVLHVVLAVILSVVLGVILNAILPDKEDGEKTEEK